MSGYHSSSIINHLDTNGGQPSWPTTNAYTDGVQQQQPATQSRTQQATQQPWPCPSADISLSERSAGSRLWGNGQPSPPSWEQFFGPSRSPLQTRAASSLSPPFMIQPDRTQAIGHQGAQESATHARYDVSAAAQDGRASSLPASQFPPQRTAAQVNTQAPREAMQHGSASSESQIFSRQGFSNVNNQNLSGSTNHRQGSPQRPLVPASQQQPYFALRNSQSPTQTSVRPQLPSSGLPNIAAIATQSVPEQPDSASSPPLPIQQPGIVQTGAVNAFARPKHPAVSLNSHFEESLAGLSTLDGQQQQQHDGGGPRSDINSMMGSSGD